MGKSTFKLVQPGFIKPIISRYLTHSYVTGIVIPGQPLAGWDKKSRINMKPKVVALKLLTSNDFAF